MKSFESKFNLKRKEDEMSQELPEKFDALIVLGAGWNKFGKETNPNDPRYNLNMEAKVRTLAAGEMFKEKLKRTNLSCQMGGCDLGSHFNDKRLGWPKVCDSKKS